MSREMCNNQIRALSSLSMEPYRKRGGLGFMNLIRVPHRLLLPYRDWQILYRGFHSPPFPLSPKANNFSTIGLKSMSSSAFNFRTAKPISPISKLVFCPYLYGRYSKFKSLDASKGWQGRRHAGICTHNWWSSPRRNSADVGTRHDEEFINKCKMVYNFWLPTFIGYTPGAQSQDSL